MAIPLREGIVFRMKKRKECNLTALIENAKAILQASLHEPRSKSVSMSRLELFSEVVKGDEAMRSVTGNERKSNHVSRVIQRTLRMFCGSSCKKSTEKLFRKTILLQSLSYEGCRPFHYKIT